jgi:hypothetical protein
MRVFRLPSSDFRQNISTHKIGSRSNGNKADFTLSAVSSILNGNFAVGQIHTRMEAD